MTADQFRKAVDTKTYIESLDNELRRLDADYKKRMADVEAKIRDARDLCGHAITRYFPDPSGNNDSTTICEICGKES